MPTRATIRSLARIRADQTNSTFPTDAEYNTLIDSAAQRVWRKLIKAGWNPSRQSTTITANGAGQYDVALNIADVVSVQKIDGATVTPLPRIKVEEWEAYLSRGAGPAEVYDLVEGVTGVLRIQFYPRPTVGSYQVWYNEIFNGFANDAASWYGPPGSDELVALLAATWGLEKEGADTSQIEKSYAEAYAEVCEFAGLLDAHFPKTVRDTRNTRTHLTAFDWNVYEGWC